MSQNQFEFLVGDNPFHGISHLSQESARNRGDYPTLAANASQLVLTALENGAQGFMFTISNTTLSIIEELKKSETDKQIKLYALCPYAYEYVRLATQLGGIPGLAKKVTREILFSGNIPAISAGIKGFLFTDISSILRTYLLYEMNRLKKVAGNNAILESILLHEVITDMALALDLKPLFQSFIDFMIKKRLKPGFETRNFVYLMNKFEEWNIDLSKIVIATPFNKIGFLMNPSQESCENALKKNPETKVIAMSVLAAGYLKPAEALGYLNTIPIKAAVIGISSDKQAKETFSTKIIT